jgi:hypothetical protein
MMGRWLQLADELESSDPPRANSADSANKADPGPIGPNDTNGTGLPPDLRKGLDRLARMAAPALVEPDVWPGIVADALRLAEDGWAEKAIALGWDPMHLWGAHLYEPGLAVWLRCRRIVMLDATHCAVSDRPGAWSLFHKRPLPDGAMFLWYYPTGERR